MKKSLVALLTTLFLFFCFPLLPDLLSRPSSESEPFFSKVSKPFGIHQVEKVRRRPLAKKCLSHSVFFELKKFTNRFSCNFKDLSLFVAFSNKLNHNLFLRSPPSVPLFL